MSVTARFGAQSPFSCYRGKVPGRILTVIVNKAGGAAAAAGEGLTGQIAAAFEKSGAQANVRMLDGAAIADAVREASAGGRVVVAGGDGTVACAAGVLSGEKAELALLPLGTLNHFSRDLGVPTELEAAAALAATGEARAVDVAEVNGHRFLNNASIGIYPFMVARRDAVRERKGWPKWLATAPAAWTALKRLPHHRLRLDMGKGARQVVTPMLFVGNNLYALEAGEVGRRASLSGGVLGVYAVSHRSRLSLIWFALRTLAGRADFSTDFEAIGECEALTVEAHSGSIEIALDGELLRLETPLRFRIEPGALRVIAPPDTGEA